LRAIGKGGVPVPGVYGIRSCSSASGGKELLSLERRLRESSVSVVVLGWFGAQDRHVQKYCNFWTSLGVQEVTQHTCSVQAVLFPPQGDKESREFLLGEKMQTGRNELEEIEAKGEKKKKKLVIYHVFSLGGFVFFASILMQNLTRAGMRHDPWTDVAGIVFDSGPPVELSAKNALCGITTGLVVSDEGVPEKLYSNFVFRGLWHAAWGAYQALAGYQKRYDAIKDVFSEHGPKNQLYLYTEEDRILDFQAIEKFIEGQAKLEGKEISTKKWTKGKHVQLLREYEEEYKAELVGFLKRILSS
jgi:hypothetical protein